MRSTDEVPDHLRPDAYAEQHLILDGQQLVGTVSRFWVLESNDDKPFNWCVVVDGGFRAGRAASRAEALDAAERALDELQHEGGELGTH